MTLIELLVFLFFCSFALSLGSRIRQWSGSLLLGVIGGVAGVVLFVLGMNLLMGFWDRLFPLRPRCRRGKCGAYDYHWDPGLWQESRMHVYTCNCGDKYVRKGRRFSELLPDGSVRPYMKRPFLLRVWSVDEIPAPRPDGNHE